MSHTDSDVEELPYDSTTEYESYECEEEEEEEEYGEEEEVFNSEDFISGATYGDKCTLTSDILEFDFSYGYDCKRYYNLVVADEQTLIFASGNFINFFNTETKEIWFRRSAFGGGIGHLTKNPNPEVSHVAIAENGDKPPIIIYDWPTLEIVAVLRGGASKIYTHVSYNPSGSLLVSQSGDPDYLITIWNWPKSRILLRTKSYVNDVYKVMFSPSVPGHLTSCGVAHIKFWKMAKTFTGLKLQGDLGRFGKTEYSDILGIYPLPDEKVISGCFWGNFLIWDEGLIKVEVFRKHRKNCHDGPIVQFDFKNGDLWTIAMDGRIRVWHYEPIDQADPPDDDRVVQVEPVHDFYTPGVQFMFIIKQNDDITNTFYYAQDGNGGLWRIDLNTEGEVKPSEQLYKCHAGPIVDIAACPWGPYLVSLGDDGRLQVYNYIKRTLIFIHEFTAKGRAMIWLPLWVQESGDQIIMAFDDGILRSVGLMITEATDTIKMFVMQVVKPHSKPITTMSLNTTGNVLVTAGEDKTIFVFKVQPAMHMHCTLIPIGYIFTPDIPNCLTWHIDQETTVIIGCLRGHLMQVEVPAEQQHYTTITYILNLQPIENKFSTYKSQIRRDIKLREIAAKKEKKRDKKRVEMKKILADNPGLEIDEEIFLADSESTETLTPLFIPETPNKILWMQSLKNGGVWLSVGGYDAGYIYEVIIEQMSEVPNNFRMVYDADDIEISSYVYNYNRKYLIFAMEDGVIRVNKVNPDDYMDLSDYWKLSMHDNLNGYVPKMCFSYDEKYFFSCGHDGNIFSYQFFPENDDYITDIPIRKKIFKEFEYRQITDTYNYESLSLEQAIVKAEEDRVLRVANERKATLRNKLGEYGAQLLSLIDRNEALLPSQTISREEFEIDPIITEHLQNRLSANLELVKRKLEFQVEKSKVAMQKLLKHFIEPLDVFPIVVTGIVSKNQVKTLRQKKIDESFFKMQQIVDEKIIEAELKGRPPERPPPPPEVVQVRKPKEKELEYFLMGLSPSTLRLKLGAKLTRLLGKYRARKYKNEKRKEEWEDFYKLKPIEGVNHPDDEIALMEAIKSIGDYKLKTSEDYKVPHSQRETTVKKYKELLVCRQQQYDLRHNFNVKVYNLRDKKVNCKLRLEKLTKELENIHEEIPKDKHKYGPPISVITDEDFPEKNIEVDVPFPETPVSLYSVKNLRLIDHVHHPTPDKFEKETLPVEGEEIITAWEEEAKKIRLTRKIFEQDQITEEMYGLIKEYDEDLEDLIAERIQVSVDAKFMDLHLLRLHQELIILKDFESKEDTLTERVNSRIMELMDMQDNIQDVNNRIDAYKAEMILLQEQEKKIQNQFFTAATDNKFYDFLRRIFKKRYRPPKIRDPDDEEEESESESSEDESEEEEEGSIDSRDFGIIRLDESVCPKGCDQGLYDLTYELRGQRHQVELKIKDVTTNIANLKKELEAQNKKLKVVESNVQACQLDLELYQREKQKRLNQVMATIVLKLNQIQNLLKDKDFSITKISETLIFSQPALTKLYKRVGQLQTESIKQKSKHKLNISHLCRMRNDCKYMGKDIAKLKKEVVEAMTRKFGKVVDLDELEEAHLRRMVFELRMSLTDIRGLYDHEMKFWRDKYEMKQIALADAIKENTEKMDLLAVLNKEKSDLAKIIEHQRHKKYHLESVVDISQIYKKDIAKLADVVENQRKEMQQLRNEIKMLQTKGLSLKEWELPKLSKPDVEEEEEDDGLDWGGTMEEFIEQHWDYYSAQEMERSKEEKSSKEHIKLLLQHVPSSAMRKQKEAQRQREVVEEVVRDTILEMIDNLDISAVQYKVDSVMDAIIQRVLNSTSINQIIKVLLDNLPIEGTDEQQGILETAAEKLYAAQEPEVTETEILECATEILQEILEVSLSEKGHTIYMISELVSNLVQELPISFLTKGDIMDMILSNLVSSLSFIEVDKEELSESLQKLTGPLAEDMRYIMNIILESVFGVGIDYLYILNERFREETAGKYSITLKVRTTNDFGEEETGEEEKGVEEEREKDED